MIAGLAIYNIDLKYMPGRKIVIEYCLSKYFIIATLERDKTVNKVVHSVESHNIEFSEDKLKLFQNNALDNKVLK